MVAMRGNPDRLREGPGIRLRRFHRGRRRFCRGAVIALLPVVGEEVRKGDLVLTVSTTGQIRSEAVVSLKLEAAGIVTEVLARAGDRVKKGQAIIKLDPRPFDIAVAEAEASLGRHELQLLDNTLPDSLVSGKRSPASGCGTPRFAPAWKPRGRGSTSANTSGSARPSRRRSMALSMTSASRRESA